MEAKLKNNNIEEEDGWSEVKCYQDKEGNNMIRVKIRKTKAGRKLSLDLRNSGAKVTKYSSELRRAMRADQEWAKKKVIELKKQNKKMLEMMEKSNSESSA